MSAATDVYLFKRQAPLERLRCSVVGVARHPKLIVGTAIAGMVGTLAAMLIVGNAGEIGAIAFVPWVALLAARLGPAAGGLVGAAAMALYAGAAETGGGAPDPGGPRLRGGAPVGGGPPARPPPPPYPGGPPRTPAPK